MTTPTTHGAEVTVRELSKTYRVPGGAPVIALDAVSLDVPAGSAVALMGPSGSGKSTLLHHIGGVDVPDGGSIVVGGIEVTSLRGRALAGYRRRVGFVFQRFNLIPSLSLLDNILAPTIPYRPTRETTARARDLLHLVGLADRADSNPSRLSGGQQQRVAIARALIGNPDVILADEPTGALDSQTGEEIMTLLLASGVTTIIATHDATVAEHCHRTIHLADGALTTAPPTPTPPRRAIDRHDLGAPT